MSTLSEEDTSKITTVGGYNVHYNEAGEGDTVVMLHGGWPGASAYNTFKANFAAFANQHRTLLVDLLSYGKSDNGNYQTEPPLVVRPRALRDLLDELGIEKANFVGNSLGGSTSLAFAVDYPDRTGRLVLTGPAGLLYPAVLHPTPTEGHRRLAEAAKNPTTDTFRELAEAMLFDPSVMDDGLISECVAAAQARTTSNALHDVPERNLSDELHKVRAKTLIFWGKDDRVNHWEIGIQLLRDLEDASMFILKNCGHLVQGEHPQEFNRIALEFLAK